MLFEVANSLLAPRLVEQPEEDVPDGLDVERPTLVVLFLLPVNQLGVILKCRCVFCIFVIVSLLEVAL